MTKYFTKKKLSKFLTWKLMKKNMNNMTCLYCLAVESEVISLLDPKDQARSPSSTQANHIPGFWSRGGKIDCLNPAEQ